MDGGESPDAVFLRDPQLLDESYLGRMFGSDFELTLRNFASVGQSVV